MRFDRKWVRTTTLCLAGLLVLVWLMADGQRALNLWNKLSSLFAPLVAGAAVAFVLNVPMRAVERQIKGVNRPGLRRGIAIALTVGLILLVITFVICLLVPQIEKAIEKLAVQLPLFANRVSTTVQKLLDANPELKKWVEENTQIETINWSTILEQGASYIKDLQTAAGTVVGSAVTAIGSLTSGVMNVFVSTIFAIYCLSRKEILARQGRRILYSFLPERACDEIIRILRLTNATFSKFISGQCVEACILGCLFAVTMLLFGMPYIPLVSVVIAVTALVPVVGAWAGCIIGALFIMVDSPLQALTFVAMFLVLQQLENNLIYPRVVGTSIGLPGMWVLAAVTIGGGVMGVGGMLLMIPLASVVYTLLGEFTAVRVAERNIPPEKLREHPPELQTPYHKRKERMRSEKLDKLLRKFGKK